MIDKLTKSVATAAALLIAGTLVTAASAGEEDVLLDRVAAVVNGRAITLSEVEQTASPLLRELPAGIDRQAARVEALSEALEALIDEKLMEDAIDSREIEVTEQEVDRAIVEVRRQHGLTESEFRQALMAQGFTWDGYRSELARQLERHKLLGAEVQARVDVTEEDVRGYLARSDEQATEEALVRHILVRLSPDASENAIEEGRRRAQEAMDRVQAGEDFAEVAREVSEDGSAAAGGDLGWLRRGWMAKTLDEAVFGTIDKEIIGPVRSQSGWHVLEVVERRVHRQERDPLAEQRARQALLEEALELETRRFLDNLRRQAVIETKIPEIENDG